MDKISIALDKVIKARNNAYTALGMEDADDILDTLKGIIDLLEEAEDELLEVADD